MNRILNLDSVNDVSYKIKIPNMNELTPLDLTSKYIDDLISIDSIIPSDLYGEDKINKVNSSTLDNYYFQTTGAVSPNGTNSNSGSMGGNGSRFENIENVNLPDSFFEEFNGSELISKNGLFNEINRCWFIIDNKLILWNYKAPQSSFNKSVFLNIDLRYLILSVKICKPKEGIFIKDVNYILIIATTMDIHIYVIKYNSELNNLEMFNPNLSVSIQGLMVNNIISHSKTNDIYFSEGNNIWRLDYSNKSSFIKNKCDKVCLTKSGFINKISIFNDDQQQIPESIVQLDLDEDRDVLYSLSNKSIIRTYKITKNQEQFTVFNKITPSEIFKNVSSLFVDSGNFKSFSKFKIISISAIKRESTTVQLIAITNFGVRILLKLGMINSLFFSSSSNSLRLSVVTLKFPPSKELPTLNNELDSFTRSKQYINQVISNQQKSQLLKNAKFSKILSPGIFLLVKKSKNGDKLFVSTVNYGFLKKNNKIIEDAEFLKISGTKTDVVINDIVQLTPSMNATNQSNGYANILACQYTKEPLKFAILTNYGIQIFQYQTPDKLLKDLNDERIENFVEENGFEETCSTLLYLSCSTNYLNRKAIMLFSTIGNNARIIDEVNNLNPSNINNNEKNQVVLSDRFYGTCLLISRIFRDYWSIKIFNQQKEKDQSKILININKAKIEYFIGSVIVLLEFFTNFSNNIPGLNAPNYSSDPTRFDNEICLRSEHIAFTSVIKSLNSMKEALSFLMILIEETNFNEIFNNLNASNQRNLLSLQFNNLLLPNNDTKNLIKDLLSSIINKNILKGGSIDYITNSLQDKCGSFISTDDILIFKAIENLTKAKNYRSRDQDMKVKCLKNAIQLFEKASKSLTLENIENSVNIMLDLDYYVGSIELLIKLVLSQSKKDSLYGIIFNILNKIDGRILQANEIKDTHSVKELMEIRDLSYQLCFNCKDKSFHYKFYQWFIDEGNSDKLLDINTQYILDFLKEKSNENIQLSELLYKYYAKREKYYEAGSILYYLSISEFPIELVKRLEYLSRANGFCNCNCPSNLRQKMIQLSTLIQDLFDVGNIQLDLLKLIETDKRINSELRTKSLESLNNKILNLTDLFNDFTDPLGYYNLSLIIFKISDYRNSDDIFKRWELLIEKIYYNSSKDNKLPFYIELVNQFNLIGSKISSNDLVFPIDKLIKLISKYLNDAFEEDPLQQTPQGVVVDLFIKSGITYDKLYYIFKSIIEQNHEIYPGFMKFLKNEMVYLIKNWYLNDKNLRNLVSNEDILKLDDYSVDKDPIGK